MTMGSDDDIDSSVAKGKENNAARSALHRAMKDFKDSSSSQTLKERRRQHHQKMKPFINVQREKIGSVEKVDKVEKRQEQGDNNHLVRMAELDCKAYGGPSSDAAQEIVYWQDIPSDSLYVSPFSRTNRQNKAQREYLTFEPDGGGWNNIRMAMESTIGLSIAMGRTLVMPPQKKMYLLGKNNKGQQHHFSFVDFFPIAEIVEDNQAFEVVSMKEYLEEEGMKGKLINQETGKSEFPPGNRTDWDGIDQADYDLLRGYLRNVSNTLRWNPTECLSAFPSSGKHQDVEILQGLVLELQSETKKKSDGTSLFEVDNPDPIERLKDNLAGRKQLCVYDENIQKEKVVHFQCNHKKHLRLLVHFYAFLFFEDWREDLWMKRFVRDHLHYRDEIQCAAARIVDKIRQHVNNKTNTQTNEFDTFHIRRGDFQYKETRVDIQTIIKNTEAELTPGSTVFIATDERDKNFFKPMGEIYDLLFLDDFKNELEGVNSNYYGMIDQIVASRGRIFFGCWFSTFTGYINRIRGYHSVKDKAPGYKNGELPKTFYYATKSRKNAMHKYAPFNGGFFQREYPTSWRDIDKGIQEVTNIVRHN